MILSVAQFVIFGSFGPRHVQESSLPGRPLQWLRRLLDRPKEGTSAAKALSALSAPFSPKNLPIRSQVPGSPIVSVRGGHAIEKDRSETQDGHDHLQTASKKSSLGVKTGQKLQLLSNHEYSYMCLCSRRNENLPTRQC